MGTEENKAWIVRLKVRKMGSIGVTSTGVFRVVAKSEKEATNKAVDAAISEGYETHGTSPNVDGSYVTACA